jgi:hypothetical protein
MFVFKCTYTPWTGAKMSEHGVYIYLWPVFGQFIEKLWWIMGWNGVIEFRTHIWKCTNMLFVSAVSFNYWCSKPYLMWWIFNLGNPTWGWLDYFTNISEMLLHHQPEFVCKRCEEIKVFEICRSKHRRGQRFYILNGRPSWNLAFKFQRWNGYVCTLSTPKNGHK